MAWLRNGTQNCSRCSGSGCYQCHRTGTITLCPGCANTEPSLISKDDDGNLLCSVCGITFTKGGEILMPKPPDPPKKKVVKKVVVKKATRH